VTSRAAFARPVRRLVAFIGALILVSACGSNAAAPQVAPNAAPKAPATVDGAKLTTLTMKDATGYTPRSINGGTDDYHCTLVNPHVSQNSFIVSSEFFPGSGKSVAEVHHAILFLVPPNLAKAAETANNGGKGWTCFGEPPVLGTGLKQFLSMPWLSAWAPGKGKDVLPATTGTPLPKGSLIIMQVHYNLLAGDLPVSPHVQLDTVPASANLRPTSIQPLVAIPNIACPTGVTGPLCDRTAELANLSKRFGPYMPLFDAGVERICGENPASPPISVTTSCTWPVRKAGYIIRAAPHMHLLGQSLKITLNPGTAHAKTVLDVPNYDFNNQAAHNDTPWLKVAPGDKLQVSCTYNPELAQELPALRSLPSHFVTWGDGTSDEMCLGLAVEVPLDPHATVDWADPTGANRVGQL
jgi:Copper type II ascorbate-dependent monooxygenase, C-terminal domain